MRFVGRTSELSTLEALVVDARQGRGKLALVTGEPGIGKTRLAEELERRSIDFASAWGRAWEGSGTPAFWPWTQALRQLASFEDLATAFVDPELDALLEASARPAVTADAEQARFRLFDAASRALARAGRARPVLLVLDDLHAADASTLALLHFVARGLRGAAVLIIATSRDKPFAELPSLLAPIQREAVHVPLGYLSREEVGTWVDSAAPRIEVDRVWAVSDGNPLFIEELLAAAQKRPDALWSVQAIPLALEDVIRTHLGLLSARGQRLLETASVLGRELTRTTLEAIAPGEIDAIDETIFSGVIRDGGDEKLRFSHILLRDQLYARLDSARRKELHRAVARSVTDRSVAAHHALLGARPEDARWALGLVREAMGNASSRLAHEDAARLGTRALDALGAHLGQEEVCALRLGIAEAMIAAGDVAASRAMSHEAASIAIALGRGELVARAALARAAEVGFEPDEGAIAWLRHGLDALPPNDSTLRAELMATLASALVPFSYLQREEVRRLREGAIAMARVQGDENALLSVLNNSSTTFPADLLPHARFALYAETIDVAERVGRIGRVAPLLCWHVVSWLDIGKLEGARAAMERMAALLEPYPQPVHRWRIPLMRAVLASVEGHFDEADALARRSLAIAKENDIREGLMMHATFRATLAYVRGDDGGLAEIRATFDELFAWMPLHDIFDSIFDAPLGRVERVSEALARLRPLPLDDVHQVATLAWACVRAGATEHAELFYELATRPPAHNPIEFAPGGFGAFGLMAQVRGDLAMMLGRLETARAHFEEAATFAHSLGAPPWIAQAELGLAGALAPLDRAAASEHARIAARVARAVGMTAVAEKAERFFASSAPRSRTSFSIARAGELWIVENGPHRISLPDSKGLKYLEALVAVPGRRLHVLELSGIDESGDAGPLLDESARTAYRARAEELRAQIDEASSFNDSGKLERLERELEALSDELARAFGLGGRERRAGSVTERARINVQRRLRAAIARIAQQDEGLGNHLERSVETGTFCVYLPVWPR